MTAATITQLWFVYPTYQWESGFHGGERFVTCAFPAEGHQFVGIYKKKKSNATVANMPASELQASNAAAPDWRLSRLHQAAAGRPAAPSVFAFHPGTI